jgi:transmembrane protein 17
MHLKAINVVSSLVLQKILYFNGYYDLVFGLIHLALSVYKIVYVPSSVANKIIPPVLTAIWFLIEVTRLRLGYSGNLTEKVPELSAFWLLTILPQLPVVVFLCFVQPGAVPLDVASGIFMAAFLVSATCIAAVAARFHSRNDC